MSRVNKDSTHRISCLPFMLSHCPFHASAVSLNQMLQCVRNIDGVSVDIHLRVSPVFSLTLRNSMEWSPSSDADSRSVVNHILKLLWKVQCRNIMSSGM